MSIYRSWMFISLASSRVRSSHLSVKWLILRWQFRNSSSALAATIAVGWRRQNRKSVIYVLLCSSTIDKDATPTTGNKKKKTAYLGFGGAYMYDTPTVIICSVAEMQAEPPSTELQTFKNMGVSANPDFPGQLEISLLFLVSSIPSRRFCVRLNRWWCNERPTGLSPWIIEKIPSLWSLVPIRL